MHSFRLSIQLDFYFLYKNFFCGCAARLAGLGSRPGIESELSAVQAWSLNHWKAKEVPLTVFIVVKKSAILRATFMPSVSFPLPIKTIQVLPNHLCLPRIFITDGFLYLLVL